MKDRIKKIQEYSGLSLGVFASRTGIKSASLSHILNGRNNPSLDVVMKIHDTFPEISYDWLIYGRGPMLNGGNVEPVENKPVDSTSVPSTDPYNRTIFDNDSAKVEEIILDGNEDDSVEDIQDELKSVVSQIMNPSTSQPVESKPVETVAAPQRSESEIIDEFMKSDSFKCIVDAQSKAKEKSVKKIIVLYDDETFAEYSLNKL